MKKANNLKTAYSFRSISSPGEFIERVKAEAVNSELRVEQSAGNRFDLLLDTNHGGNIVYRAEVVADENGGSFIYGEIMTIPWSSTPEKKNVFMIVLSVLGGIILLPFLLIFLLCYGIYALVARLFGRKNKEYTCEEKLCKFMLNRMCCRQAEDSIDDFIEKLKSHIRSKDFYSVISFLNEKEKAKEIVLYAGTYSLPMALAHFGFYEEASFYIYTTQDRHGYCVYINRIGCGVEEDDKIFNLSHRYLYSKRYLSNCYFGEKDYRSGEFFKKKSKKRDTIIEDVNDVRTCELVQKFLFDFDEIDKREIVELLEKELCCPQTGSAEYLRALCGYLYCIGDETDIPLIEKVKYSISMDVGCMIDSEWIESLRNDGKENREKSIRNRDEITNDFVQYYKGFI